MAVAPDRLDSRHTLFEARYRTERGLRLQAAPFDVWRATLVHPSEYGPTQALSAAVRDAGVQAFEFTSTRDPESGHNAALVKPAVLVSTHHLHPSGRMGTTPKAAVTFSRRGSPSEVRKFPVSAFVVGKALPRAA